MPSQFQVRHKEQTQPRKWRHLRFNYRPITFSAICKCSAYRSSSRPGLGNGTCQSTRASVHASQWGTTLPFLCLPPRQTTNTEFPSSPSSETWGFSLTRPSPRQCTAERLRIQQDGCLVWSTGLPRLETEN